MWRLVLQLVLLLDAVPTVPKSCAYLDSEKVYSGDLIVLEVEADIVADITTAAIDVWRSCDEYGVGFPAFVLAPDLLAGQSGRLVQVESRKMGPGQRCGSFHGSRIVLYAFARDARGEVMPCGSWEQNLAHELGHVLGLPHAPSTPRCKPRIMATLDSHNADRRRITSEECRSADRRWRTSAERE